MANPAEITVTMNLSKETKGSYRYDAVEDAAPIRDVYIHKPGLPGGAVPRQVEITMKAC